MHVGVCACGCACGCVCMWVCACGVCGAWDVVLGPKPHSIKEGNSIKSNYGNSITNALAVLYPDIKLPHLHTNHHRAQKMLQTVVEMLFDKSVYKVSIPI